MRELGGKKTGHFMLKVGIYLTVILGMIVQLISASTSPCSRKSDTGSDWYAHDQEPR